MTPCSAACGGSDSRRLSSRSACRRTSSGSPASSSWAAQLGGLLGDLVELAELLADRVELLAQDVLALRAVQLGLDLGLDARADRDDLELAREDVHQAPQPAGDVDLLQELLLLLGLEPQRPGDEVAEGARVVEVGDRHLQLLGEVGHLLDDVRERPLHVAHERGQLGRLVDDVGQLGDLGDEVGGLLHEAVDVDALGALDQDPQRPVGDLEHPRDGAHHAHAVELVRAGSLELRVARGDHDQHPVAGQDVVDQPHAALLADGQRRQPVGQRDRLAQREDRQAPGQSARDAYVDDAVAVLLTGDLDHEPSPSPRAGTSIGTLRRRSSAWTSGSSTRRMPSRYVARAASGATSAPSGMLRRNGPKSISSCW